MSEFIVDFAGEPQKVFVNFLIWQIRIIEGNLYMTNNFDLNIFKMIQGLIDSLDEKSKKYLENQYKSLEGMKKGTVKRDYEDIARIYREILTYLHQTYLQEVSWARPLNVKPKHIGGSGE